MAKVGSGKIGREVVEGDSEGIKSLKLLRAMMGMSKYKIAKEAGLNYATVHNWDMGKSKPDAESTMRMGILVKRYTELTAEQMNKPSEMG